MGLAAEQNQEVLWYVHLNGQCFGPFKREQLIQLIVSKQLDDKAKVFRTDTKVWRPVLDCVDELSDNEASPDFKSERRVGAPRAELTGRVLLKRDNESVGISKDVSVSGIFVVTSETRFSLGEVVDIEVHSPELDKIISTQATIVRYNANFQTGIGYGLQFHGLDDQMVGMLSQFVKAQLPEDEGEAILHMSPDSP